MTRFFIVLTLVWFTSLACLIVGYPQPTFIIFVSYGLNALSCLLMAGAFSRIDGVEVVRGDSKEGDE